MVTEKKAVLSAVSETLFLFLWLWPSEISLSYSCSFQHHSNCLLQIFPSSSHSSDKERDCLPSSRAQEDICHLRRGLGVLPVSFCLGPFTVHGKHAMEFHFPFANSHLSSKNSLWWDLSPGAEIRCACSSSFLKPASCSPFFFFLSFLRKALGKIPLGGHDARKVEMVSSSQNAVNFSPR